MTNTIKLKVEDEIVVFDSVYRHYGVVRSTSGDYVDIRWQGSRYAHRYLLSTLYSLGTVIKMCKTRQNQ